MRITRNLLDPTATILFIVLLHFLWIAFHVAQDLQTENGRSADVQFYLCTPLLLLLAAFLLWHGKLVGRGMALLISGYMVYQMGYLGYLGSAKVVNAPVLSLRALNAFYRALFDEWGVYTGRNRDTLQLALAGIITSSAAVFILVEAIRRLRSWRGTNQQSEAD